MLYFTYIIRIRLLPKNDEFHFLANRNSEQFQTNLADLSTWCCIENSICHWLRRNFDAWLESKLPIHNLLKITFTEWSRMAPHSVKTEGRPLPTS